MSDIFDDWEVDDGMAPEGPPEELLHLAMLGEWRLTVEDALALRQHMDPGKPPVGDSTWKHELEHKLRSQLHPDVHGIARRLAWAAYRQGILHGELLAKHQKP
jgi:hypothetical protein